MTNTNFRLTNSDDAPDLDAEFDTEELTEEQLEALMSGADDDEDTEDGDEEFPSDEDDDFPEGDDEDEGIGEEVTEWAPPKTEASIFEECLPFERELGLEEQHPAVAAAMEYLLNVMRGTDAVNALKKSQDPRTMAWISEQISNRAESRKRLVRMVKRYDFKQINLGPVPQQF